MIALNLEHCTLGFVFGFNVEEMNSSELKSFIDKYIRQKSTSTGKLVKVNTFSWKKAQLKELVSTYLDACYNNCEQ